MHTVNHVRATDMLHFNLSYIKLNPPHPVSSVTDTYLSFILNQTDHWGPHRLQAVRDQTLVDLTSLYFLLYFLLFCAFNRLCVKYRDACLSSHKQYENANKLVDLQWSSQTEIPKFHAISNQMACTHKTLASSTNNKKSEP